MSNAPTSNSAINGLPRGQKGASLSGCVLDLFRHRSVQGDMGEDAADSVVLAAGFHLASEGLPVGVVSIARRQSLVFGLECLDVGGCDNKGLPGLLQLFKPDRFSYPCRNRIIHICIIL